MPGLFVVCSSLTRCTRNCSLPRVEEINNGPEYESTGVAVSACRLRTCVKNVIFADFSATKRKSTSCCFPSSRRVSSRVKGLPRRESHPAGDHLRRLESAGIDVEGAEEKGQFQLCDWNQDIFPMAASTRIECLPCGRMCGGAAAKSGYTRTRLVAHMEWALEDREGVSDLIEYEARLNLVHDPRRPGHLRLRSDQVQRRHHHGRPAGLIQPSLSSAALCNRIRSLFRRRSFSRNSRTACPYPGDRVQRRTDANSGPAGARRDQAPAGLH